MLAFTPSIFLRAEMERIKGSSRTVYVDEKVAFKIPHYEFLKDLPSSLRRIFTNQDSNILRSWIWEISYVGHIFGKGVYANLIEAFMGLVAKEVVVPTRLSLAGLLNVQEKAEQAKITSDDIENTMKVYLDNEPLSDMHGYLDPDNYGIHDGKMKMIDCGSLAVAKIIMKRRHDFRSALLELNIRQESNE